MSEHTATVSWKRRPQEQYTDNAYSRAHKWQFDGGATVPASASPHLVPLPYSVQENVDPEEAFVAALSSCHMLLFLSIAAKMKFVIDQYIDHARGLMSLDSAGRMAMTQVTLKPSIKFSGDKQPTPAQLEKMHHQSHQQCFIANSVKTQVLTEIL